MAENVSDKTRRIEENLANKLDISATTSNATTKIFRLQHIPDGAIVVDLAAGASSFIPDLIDQETDAYAVDRLYGAPRLLERKIKILVPRIVQNVPQQHKEHMRRITNEATLKFQRSIAQHPERYKPDWLTHLSFDDQFADIVTSLNGISDLAVNPDLFEQAVQEALRITKIGGRFLMAPFHAEGGSKTVYAKAHNALAEQLKAQDQQCNIWQPTQTYYSHVLEVIRPQ